MPTWFTKLHRCDCGAEWEDDWDSLCDDECPECGTDCQVAEVLEEEGITEAEASRRRKD